MFVIYIAYSDKEEAVKLEMHQSEIQRELGSNIGRQRLKLLDSAPLRLAFSPLTFQSQLSFVLPPDENQDLKISPQNKAIGHICNHEPLQKKDRSTAKL